MTDCCIIITTTNELAIADKISHTLVKSGYAKCVQKDYIDSTYEWDSKIVTSKEYRLMIKSLNAKAHLVNECIKRLHNYNLPEIIKINIDDLNEEYLKWMLD